MAATATYLPHRVSIEYLLFRSNRPTATPIINQTIKGNGLQAYGHRSTFGGGVGV